MEDGQWAEIDARIAQRLIIQAIKLIREKQVVGIREAQDILAERYKLLRAVSPGAFDCSDEEYWDGYYS